MLRALHPHPATAHRPCQDRVSLNAPRAVRGLGVSPRPACTQHPGKPVLLLPLKEQSAFGASPVGQPISLVITVAPGTGPVAVATLRQTPVPDRAAACSVAASAL